MKCYRIVTVGRGQRIFPERREQIIRLHLEHAPRPVPVEAEPEWKQKIRRVNEICERWKRANSEAG